MSPLLKRLLPIALVALALVALPHTPVRADSMASDQACGTVDLAKTSNDDAAKAFNCFNTAYSHCDPASLIATGNEADVATTWTFMTVNGDHGCSISETVDRVTGSVKTTDAYLCSSLSSEKDGLHFSGCGNKGDVALKPGDTFSQVLQPLAQQTDQNKT
jgi:hypothetical protein